jgi:ferric-chelate reductase
MNLTTLAPFRNLRYEFFVAQHIITFFALIIAIMIHIPPTALHAQTYIFTAIGLYLASRLIQTVLYLDRNVHPSRATLTRASDGVTKIRINHRKLKFWTPGSYILLSIPRYGLFQSHPATIASTPSSHGGDLVFFLRSHRGFTRRIHNAAGTGGDHLALIDGPYGGHQADFAAFPIAFLIAGSTGISFIMPILLDIAERASTVKLPVKDIHFVWTVKEESCLGLMGDELSSALSALRTEGINVFVHIHRTGAYEPSPGHDEEKVAAAVREVSSPTDSNSGSAENEITNGDGVVAEEEKDVQVRRRPVGADSDGSSRNGSARREVATPATRGRPDVKALLKNARAQLKGEMGVAVCGPLSLSTAVRNYVAAMELGKEVGEGIYLHVETFGW